MSERHRAQEFRSFLNRIHRSASYDVDVHLAIDIVSTRKTPEIHRWLLRHHRLHLLFTPTYSSWMNMVERWLVELSNKWLGAARTGPPKNSNCRSTNGSIRGTRTRVHPCGRRAPARSSRTSPHIARLPPPHGTGSWVSSSATAGSCHARSATAVTRRQRQGRPTRRGGAPPGWPSRPPPSPTPAG